MRLISNGMLGFMQRVITVCDPLLACYQHESFDRVSSASDRQKVAFYSIGERRGAETAPPPGLAYRALIALKAGAVESQGQRLKLTPGMQVAAEIHLGRRSVLEYLLSPIQKVAHEAARER